MGTVNLVEFLKKLEHKRKKASRKFARSKRAPKKCASALIGRLRRLSKIHFLMNLIEFFYKSMIWKITNNTNKKKRKGAKESGTRFPGKISTIDESINTIERPTT